MEGSGHDKAYVVYKSTVCPRAELFANRSVRCMEVGDYREAPMTVK